MDKFKVLFLSADPSDAARLRLDQELRNIREKLQISKQRDNFLLEARTSVRPGDITQAIFDNEPQILHFSGHGMSTGELCFEDYQGKTKPVQPEVLAKLFELQADHISCVILNACYSESQARVISEHIPFVIGMSQAIGDEAAITFSAGFYKALGAGRSFVHAYQFACVEIGLEIGSKDISKDSIPILYTKKDLKNSKSLLASDKGEQVTRLWKFLTLDLTGNVRQLTTSDQYYAILTEIVTKNDCASDLYVSVGEGDFLYAWLTRLYQESPLDLQPKIKRLIIKRLSDELLDDYIAKGRLAKSFKNKIERNIASIKEDDQLERNEVEIEIRFWRGFPEFHGYLCGDEMLIGKWQNNINGNLHVKTQLFYTKKQSFPKEYQIVKMGFE